MSKLHLMWKWRYVRVILLFVCVIGVAVTYMNLQTKHYDNFQNSFPNVEVDKPTPKATFTSSTLASSGRNKTKSLGITSLKLNESKSHETVFLIQTTSNISGPIPPVHNKPSHHEPVIVIILAYMHTGSTYTGSILQQHTGTFYEYEPLRSLQTMSHKRGSVTYLNGTIRRLSDASTYTDVASEAVAHMITCQHEKLDISTLGNYYFSLKSNVMRDTAAFFACQHRKPKSTRPISSQGIKDCITLLTNKCRKAETRVVKFIRMSMQMVEYVLKKLNNVKIIHLVRDPRAMLDSQVRKNDMRSRNALMFAYNTKKMCSRMRSNIELAETLRQLYPDRLTTLRYEDLVEEPLNVAKSLFDFLGLPFGAGGATFVRKNSYDAAHNSTTKSTVWRYHITQPILDTVDLNCQYIYNSMGYIQYKSVLDIKMFSKPTYIKRNRLSNITFLN